MSESLAALIAIQAGLKAPKDKKANAYLYRSIEDVNEAVKPLAHEQGCAVYYTDSFDVVNGVLCCVSTCHLCADDGEIYANACSVVETSPKFMSKEQASGAASSYARKYAACGLFAIDDSSNDPDATQQDKPAPAQAKPAAKKDPAKAERNAAVLELNDALKAYCDAHNGDFAAMKTGVKKRSDYADTAEFYLRVAAEFRAEIS